MTHEQCIINTLSLAGKENNISPTDKAIVRDTVHGQKEVIQNQMSVSKIMFLYFGTAKANHIRQIWTVYVEKMILLQPSDPARHW